MRKKYSMILFFIFFSFVGSTQIDSLEFINKNERNNFLQYLQSKLIIYFDSIDFNNDDCVEYINLFKFKIDKQGNVNNESDAVMNDINTTSFDKNFLFVQQGLDSLKWTQITKAIENIIKSTGGMWKLSNKQFELIEKKPLSVIIGYTFFGNCSSKQYAGFSGGYTFLKNFSDTYLIAFYFAKGFSHK